MKRIVCALVSALGFLLPSQSAEAQDGGGIAGLMQWAERATPQQWSAYDAAVAASKSPSWSEDWFRRERQIQDRIEGEKPIRISPIEVPPKRESAKPECKTTYIDRRTIVIQQAQSSGGTLSQSVRISSPSTTTRWESYGLSPLEPFFQGP